MSTGKAHPLLEKFKGEPMYWATWPQAMAVWNRPGLTVEEMQQVLHRAVLIPFGYTDKGKHEAKMWLFYLAMADNWPSHQPFMLPGEQWDSQNPQIVGTVLEDNCLLGGKTACHFHCAAEVRQKVAQTAFECLVKYKIQPRKFWGMNQEEREKVLDALFHFFRIKKNGPEEEDEFVNFPSNSDAAKECVTAAKKFLFDLCTQWWDQPGCQTPFCTSGNIGQVLPDAAMFEKHTEQIIRTLHLLGKLGEAMAYPHLVRRITQEWLPVLWEMAFEKELYFEHLKTRMPKSLEEAMLGHTGGSLGRESVHAARGYRLLMDVRPDLFEQDYAI